jgi:hypothetical protein
VQVDRLLAFLGALFDPRQDCFRRSNMIRTSSMENDIAFATQPLYQIGIVQIAEDCVDFCGPDALAFLIRCEIGSNALILTIFAQVLLGSFSAYQSRDFILALCEQQCDDLASDKARTDDEYFACHDSRLCVAVCKDCTRDEGSCMGCSPIRPRV